MPRTREGLQVSRNAPEEQDKGNPAILASKSASLGCQLKCLYANACSMGKSKRHYRPGETRRGCHSLCWWPAGVQMIKELTKSLWVRIKGRAGTGDIIVRVCYRPLDQKDPADEALYRQISSLSFASSGLQGGFNHPDIFWRNKIAGHKQSSPGK